MQKVRQGLNGPLHCLTPHLAAGVAPTEHGKAGDGPGVVKVWDMVVSETQTTVKVMWQDGTIEENISAAELVPYLNVDESEVWYVNIYRVALLFPLKARSGPATMSCGSSRTSSASASSSPRMPNNAPRRCGGTKLRTRARLRRSPRRLCPCSNSTRTATRPTKPTTAATPKCLACAEASSSSFITITRRMDWSSRACPRLARLSHGSARRADLKIIMTFRDGGA